MQSTFVANLFFLVTKTKNGPKNILLLFFLFSGKELPIFEEKNGKLEKSHHM
jgi:hypothetical protein